MKDKIKNKINKEDKTKKLASKRMKIKYDIQIKINKNNKG